MALILIIDDDEPGRIESPAARWAIGVLSVVVFGAVVIVLYGMPGRGSVPGTAGALA